MTVNQFVGIRELYDRVYNLYLEKEYEAALDLSLEGIERFPQGKGFLLHGAACMAACMGDQMRTMSYLEDMLADGHWLPETYLADEDFNSVRDTPEFQRFSEASVTASRAAIGTTRPELHIVLPDQKPAQLLLALHGNGSNIAAQLDNWHPATNDGWLLAMPQSTQVSGLNYVSELGFNWDNFDIACPEVVAHYTALAEGYRVDEIVLAGFSRGGEMAIQMALVGAIPSSGFIAVCPGGPLTTEPKKWGAVIGQNTNQDLRGVMILGGNDNRVPENKQLVEMLRAAGIKVELEVYPDMGHVFPEDFGERLGDWLDFFGH